MNRLITSNSIGSTLSRVAGVTLIIGAAAVVAAVVTDAPAAGGTSGATISTPTSDSLVSVNRANKGDRLSQAPAGRSSHSSPSTEAVAPPKRVPLGCDPAFSPVADPSRGNIYKRCMVQSDPFFHVYLTPTDWNRDDREDNRARNCGSLYGANCVHRSRVRS